MADEALLTRPSVRDVLARASAGSSLTPEAEAARVAVATLTSGRMPWYLRVLIGAGAWIGASFLLSAILSLILMASGEQMNSMAVIIGVIFIAGSIPMRRRVSASPFLTQLALVICSTGQILVIVAVGLVVIVAMVGVVIDGGYAWGKQRETQNGSDAASEAGAVVLAENLVRAAQVPPVTPKTDAQVRVAVNSAARGSCRASSGRQRSRRAGHRMVRFAGSEFLMFDPDRAGFVL